MLKSQIMKFFAYSFLATLSFIVATSAPSFSQTVSNPSSPQVHAFFEYQYALEATSLSISDDHKEKIETIVDAFAKHQLSEDKASEQISSALSADERTSVVGIEQSFFAALHGIFPNASSKEVSNASMVPQNTPLDAGHFLLLLLYVDAPQNSAPAQ